MGRWSEGSQAGLRPEIWQSFKLNLCHHVFKDFSKLVLKVSFVERGDPLGEHPRGKTGVKTTGKCMWIPTC
jgi:hypothetical protein